MDWLPTRLHGLRLQFLFARGILNVVKVEVTELVLIFRRIFHSRRGIPCRVNFGLARLPRIRHLTIGKLAATSANIIVA